MSFKVLDGGHVYLHAVKDLEGFVSFKRFPLRCDAEDMEALGKWAVVKPPKTKTIPVPVSLSGDFFTMANQINNMSGKADGMAPKEQTMRLDEIETLYGIEAKLREFSEMLEGKRKFPGT